MAYCNLYYKIIIINLSSEHEDKNYYFSFPLSPYNYNL